MKPIDRFTALVSFFELESPTPHRDGLPIARIGDVGLGGGDEGHDVGLTLALRVAGGHLHFAALANLDGGHYLGVPLRCHPRRDLWITIMTKYSSTFYQGTGSVFITITIITYRRPPEPRPVRHADCV